MFAWSEVTQCLVLVWGNVTLTLHGIYDSAPCNLQNISVLLALCMNCFFNKKRQALQLPLNICQFIPVDVDF